jgi:hypothetical protein
MSTATSLEALRSSATNLRPVNPSQPSKPHTREDLSESESRAYCVSACASTAPRLSLCEARVTFAAARTQQHALSALAPGPGSHATRQPTTTPRPCQRQSQPSDSERDRWVTFLFFFLPFLRKNLTNAPLLERFQKMDPQLGVMDSGAEVRRIGATDHGA